MVTGIDKIETIEFEENNVELLIYHNGKTKLGNSHRDFFQRIKSNEVNVNINRNFPFSYYSKNLKKALSKTESITLLGEKNVERKDGNFFDVDIQTIRHYRLNAKKTFYTTVYLDKDEKLVFIDYPETE